MSTRRNETETSNGTGHVGQRRQTTPENQARKSRARAQPVRGGGAS